jgi:glycosyltransferase involved in cell wall biosynthesis
MEFNGISITVCCYNDGILLPNFLESFLLQTPVGFSVELNVIDNASTDNTKEVFKSFEDRFKQTVFGYRYFFEDKRGLNNARNRGAREASYSHVGFTDADAKFHKDYLKELGKTIQQQNALIFFGPYFPWYNIDKPKWYKDEYNCYSLNRTSGYADEGQYPNGINMVYDVNALKNVGLFSTQIVYKGFHDRGEETELFFRYKNRYPKKHMYYDADMIVYHFTRPKTMELNHWIKSYWGTGKNHAKFMEVVGAWKNIKDMLWVVKTVFIAFIKYALTFRNGKYQYLQNFLIEAVFLHIYAFSLAYHRLKNKR